MTPMRPLLLSLPLLAIAITVASCGGEGSTTSTALSASAENAQQLEELKKRVSRLEVQRLLLESRIESLESGVATVSTEEQGYSIARTQFGPFTVSTRSATPYLDGYKIKLRFGNLTNADFSGAKLNLGWGPPIEGMEHDAWKSAQKQREVSVTNQFRSGSFTDLEVILTPAKPEEVRSFTVGLELNRLELRVR